MVIKCDRKTASSLVCKLLGLICFHLLWYTIVLTTVLFWKDDFEEYVKENCYMCKAVADWLRSQSAAVASCKISTQKMKQRFLYGTPNSIL